ncbi:hypothetical protein [Flavobacterium sp.]|uniref:hypothetical protein n=1 Tax=Flavobacterium sp. TaxID=239 RepID=UPI002C95DAB6|nr:hypothetical protein [Flavobacterium sp.]HSD08869.1 hypothetical protein [Flavobacterium sp.]
MVKIIDYKTYQRKDGEEFYALVVQGGLEAVKSQETGRTYFTAKKATVSCTFTEEMCNSLVGETLPGSIKKVNTEPYEYTIPDTGEVIELNHRYDYISEEDSVIEDNVMKTELVR